MSEKYMSDKKRKKAKTEYWTPDAPVLPGETFCDLARTDPGPGRPTDESLPDVKSKERFKDAFVEAEPRFPLPRAGAAFPRLPISEAGAGPAFSINDFAANIRAQLSGKCTGWAFVINKNGQEAIAEAGGDAIVEGDQLSNNVNLNQRSFTPDTRVQVASVSKTITAIAVLRLLQDTGIGLNAAVWPYLPSDWELGNNFEGVRFRHLLSHTSGMTGVFSDALTDEEAKLAVVLGAAPGAAPAYRNINFTLFRYIIPKLWAAAELPHAHADNNVAASFFYAVYIIERIFSQMGGAIGENASTSPLEPIPTRYYPSAGATQGMDFPNFAPLAGAAGWFMTARELAAIMAFPDL